MVCVASTVIPDGGSDTEYVSLATLLAMVLYIIVRDIIPKLSKPTAMPTTRTHAALGEVCPQEGRIRAVEQALTEGVSTLKEQAKSIRYDIGEIKADIKDLRDRK
jgi:hypothetical protein